MDVIENLEGHRASAESAALHETVAREISLRWPGDAAGMDAAHRHAMEPPGKLVRPLLLLCSALALGGELHQILPAAVGFEAAHVGSLLHDDIIDQDAVRRGRPAVQTVFGPAKAIIAGNALYFEWFAALAECARRGVPTERVALAMQVQATAGADICRGAFDEIDMTGDIDSAIEDYLRMAQAKTAVLFEAACRVGAILAGAEKPTADIIGRFGRHLGTAFQMRDDLLPYDSDGTAGKPAVSDLRNQRATLPLLLAYRRAAPPERKSIRRTLSEHADPFSALAQMNTLMRRLGSLDEARAMLNCEIRQACNVLARLPCDGPAYTAVLLQIALQLSPGTKPLPHGR